MPRVGAPRFIPALPETTGMPASRQELIEQLEEGDADARRLLQVIRTLGTEIDALEARIETLEDALEESE